MKTSVALHSRPAGIAWSGVTFLTSDDGLTDGKPTRATRIEFVGGSLTDYVALVGVWSVPTVLRGVVFVFDAGVPNGVKVEVRGKRLADVGYTYALGGNSLTGRTVERDDGPVELAVVFDAGLDALVGLEIRIFDDANGSTYVDGYIDIGEIFPGQGTEIDIRREFGDSIDDPTQFGQTLGNQPVVVERKRARVIDVEICPTAWDEAYTTGDSLSRLRERLVGKRDCAIIVAFREPATGSGATDWSVVQSLALFGKCSEIGELRSLSEGPYWTMRLVFRESPGRLR